ncbi:MAG: hypothetical protein WDM96_09825 [Lacunisphaera sp.]
MKPRLLRFLALAGLLGLTLSARAAVPALPSGDAKKLADRYTLTRTRIQDLLGARQHPEPMPTTALANPFYRQLATADNSANAGPPGGATELAPQPEAADLSDIDTLAKYAAGLKLSGYLILAGQPHVAINQTICKVGDVVTVGPKEKPIFLHIEALTPQEVTLRLNETTFVLSLRKPVPSSGTTPNN